MTADRSEPCVAPLVVTYNHIGGGCCSSCDVNLNIVCDGPRCYWWDKGEDRKAITTAELVALQAEHDEYAREAAWDCEAEGPLVSTAAGRAGRAGRDATAEEARRQAVEGWPLIESNRQRDAIQRWVRHGAMPRVTEMDEPHFTLVHQWEARHGG